jgi:hypothetical protein
MMLLTAGYLLSDEFWREVRATRWADVRAYVVSGIAEGLPMAPVTACALARGLLRHVRGCAMASEVLERWDALYAEVNGRTCFGQDGVRDPEHPCEAFVTGEPSGTCESDGHYMCGECRERVVGCHVCHALPDYCDCAWCDLGCNDVAVFVTINGSRFPVLSLCASHAENYVREDTAGGAQ